MPKKGEFPKELIRVYFARLYHQCRFYVLSEQETIDFLLQYRAKLKQLRTGEGKQKPIPKGKEGLQVVLRAKVKEFFVYILTTVDWSTGVIKEIDEGWVFIVDKRTGKVCFYHKPLRRTENYLDKLTEVAEAEVHRVETMPSCSECKQLYTIKLVRLTGEFVGEYGYKIDCPNTAFPHTDETEKNFYSGMDLVHKKVLEKGFKEYHEYRVKNREEGIERETSRNIRAKKTFGSGSKGVHYVKEHVDPEVNYD